MSWPCRGRSLTQWSLWAVGARVSRANSGMLRTRSPALGQRRAHSDLSSRRLRLRLGTCSVDHPPTPTLGPLRSQRLSKDFIVTSVEQCPCHMRR